MPATISVNGLYQYDNTIFDNMLLPVQIDRNVLINYIIMECSELEILIPNPNTLKIMIETWSFSRLHSWERLYESTVQDYNMIHNYDRYEDWTDSGSRTGNRHANRNENETSSASAKGNSETKKPGYNESDGLVTTETVDTTGSSNGRVSNTASDTIQEDEQSNGEHRGHLYGNIGVTTAAQMLQGERDIQAYDVYMAITDEFKRKFCAVVY